MSMQLSLKALRERREQGLTAAEDRLPSGIPVEVVLRASAPIERPVGLAEALTGFGLPLDAAHTVLNRLVEGEAVPVTLYLTQGGELPFTLSRFGLSIGGGSAPAPRLDTILTRDLVDSIERWRRAQPARPSAGEALGHIVRTYMAEHGRAGGTDEASPPRRRSEN
ncbi:UNVERIFIED_CONTAM: hypothetical protein Q9R58_01915 [Methylobacteriaceae bacterium AG10]|nr:hypothetical protein [Methylobacteriaceae bacterium AG10]